MTLERRRKLLFVCTANSCRSQMAEAWASKLKSDRIEPYSAGVAPTSIDPYAVQMMMDPGGPAADSVVDEDPLASYRRVRDEIRAFVDSLPELLEE